MKITTKIPEEIKKKLVLKKSEPKIGNEGGQKGEVQPIANKIAPIDKRSEARIQRPRSDKLNSITDTTYPVTSLLDEIVSEYPALTVSLN